MRYSVLLVPEPDIHGYTAYVPLIPGCVTQGDSIDEALAMARDAAELVLSAMVEDGEPVPDEPPGGVVSSIEVSVPNLVVAGGASSESETGGRYVE
jgi:predicted RNase H-like HicB family nuclease